MKWSKRSHEEILERKNYEDGMNGHWYLPSSFGPQKETKEERIASAVDVLKQVHKMEEALRKRNDELDGRLQEVEGIKDDLLNLAELAKN